MILQVEPSTLNPYRSLIELQVEPWTFSDAMRDSWQLLQFLVPSDHLLLVYLGFGVEGFRV